MAHRKRRLEKQLQSIQKDPVQGCVVQQIVGSEFTWSLMLEGPEGTPYTGGSFFIHVTFPNDYPFRPPKCKFQTKIYHPNIHQSGDFCVNGLKEGWSPALTISKIIMQIKDLMENPNHDHCCCVAEIAEILEKDRKKYEEIAKEWTLKYAT